MCVIWRTLRYKNSKVYGEKSSISMLIAVTLSIETLQLTWHMSQKFNLHSFWWISVEKRRETGSFSSNWERSQVIYTSILIQRRNTVTPFDKTSPSIPAYSRLSYITEESKRTQTGYPQDDTNPEDAFQSACQRTLRMLSCWDKTVTSLLYKSWINAACVSGPRHQLFHSTNPLLLRLSIC